MVTIGQLAARTGVAVSALRFYEMRGLIRAERNAGGQRRFERSEIRRVSFVLVAQKLGFSLDEIAQTLAGLPNDRTPTKADWTRIGRKFRKTLDARILAIQQLRDNLDGCIGCGCLSMERCKLYNPDDRARRLGAGPRYLMGNRPEAE